MDIQFVAKSSITMIFSNGMQKKNYQKIHLSLAEHLRKDVVQDQGRGIDAEDHGQEIDTEDQGKCIHKSCRDQIHSNTETLIIIVIQFHHNIQIPCCQVQASKRAVLIVLQDVPNVQVSLRMGRLGIVCMQLTTYTAAT